MKIGQINMGRGRAAWEMVGKVMVEREWDVVLGQEQYRKGGKIKGYRKIDNGEKAKTVIMVKEKYQISEHKRWYNKTIVVITLLEKNKEVGSFASIYIEPDREWEEIGFESLIKRAGKRREMVIIGGDFNAKNEY